jgi:hypothetical protein
VTEADVVAGVVDHLACDLGLVQDGGDEGLSAEARVDGHEEDDVDLVHDVLAVVEGGGGVEDKPGLAPALTDLLEGAVDVVGGFGVERDV